MFAETVTLSLPDAGSVAPIVWIVLGAVTWYTLAAVVIRNLSAWARREVTLHGDVPIGMIWIISPLLSIVALIVGALVLFEVYVLTPKSDR